MRVVVKVIGYRIINMYVIRFIVGAKSTVAWTSGHAYYISHEVDIMIFQYSNNEHKRVLVMTIMSGHNCCLGFEICFQILSAPTVVLRMKFIVKVK